MSDLLTAGAIGRESPELVLPKPRFSWALLISCLLSVVLVVFVGLLIAFMQYQSRLLRAQPGITAGQLLYYVEIQRTLPELNNQLREQSLELTKLTPDYTLTSNEIEFRIGRICAMFATDASGNYTKCMLFLRRIPFDDTAIMSEAKSPPSPAQPGATARATPVGGEIKPLPPESIDAIPGRFVQVMGDPVVGQVKLSEIVNLYKPDFAKIAQLNQDFSIRIDPRFKYQYELYRAKCEHYRRLLSTLYYRKFEISVCPEEGPFVDQGKAAGLPAPPPFPLAPTGSLSPQAPVTDLYNVSGLPNAPIIGGTARSPTSVPESSTPGAPNVGTSEPARSPDYPSAQAGVAGNPANPSLPQGGTVNPPATPPGQLPSLGVGIPNSGIPNQPPSPSIAPPTPLTPTTSQSDAQRDFELVTHYMFYDNLSFNRLKDILISPSEFLALLLVCFAGVLGALLRIVFYTYVSGKVPSGRNVVIGPILGLICALVVYILFRAGFIALTDRPQNSDTSSLSPFVIAFVAMAAGLLSERAIGLFRKASDTWLGSVEASQAGRWAVHLQEELVKRNLTVEALSQRLDVSADKLRDWVEEKAMVPVDKQRDIAFVLNLPVRNIFTDIEPRGQET
jgi:hypothetical protein